MSKPNEISNPDWSRDLEGPYRLELGCLGWIIVGHGTCSSTLASRQQGEEWLPRLNAARAAS